MVALTVTKSAVPGRRRRKDTAPLKVVTDSALAFTTSCSTAKAWFAMSQGTAVNS